MCNFPKQSHSGRYGLYLREDDGNKDINMNNVLQTITISPSMASMVADWVRLLSVSAGHCWPDMDMADMDMADMDMDMDMPDMDGFVSWLPF